MDDVVDNHELFFLDKRGPSHQLVHVEVTDYWKFKHISLDIIETTLAKFNYEKHTYLDIIVEFIYLSLLRPNLEIYRWLLCRKLMRSEDLLTVLDHAFGLLTSLLYNKNSGEPLLILFQAMQFMYPLSVILGHMNFDRNKIYIFDRKEKLCVTKDFETFLLSCDYVIDVRKMGQIVQIELLFQEKMFKGKRKIMFKYKKKDYIIQLEPLKGKCTINKKQHYTYMLTSVI